MKLPKVEDLEIQNATARTRYTDHTWGVEYLWALDKKGNSYVFLNGGICFTINSGIPDKFIKDSKYKKKVMDLYTKLVERVKKEFVF